MAGSTISSAPDFPNGHGLTSGGCAMNPFEEDSPAFHGGADAFGCHVGVHSRGRASILPEIRENGQHVAAGSPPPGAKGRLRVGTDDRLDGHQFGP